MTRDQQNRLNALLGDLERQVRLDMDGRYKSRYEAPQGLRIDRDSWRHMFVGTFRGWRSVPALEGPGFIMLGASSKTLTVEEASEVMTMVEAFGAERGVVWTCEQDG